MMALTRLRWFEAVPAARLGVVRLIVGLFAVGYVWVRAFHFGSYASFPAAQFAPVGPVSLLSSPVPGWMTWGLVIATALTAVPFALGWRFRVTGPLFAVLLLWTTTYRNSWGMIFHTENLLVLHVIVLALCRSADAWSLDARRIGGPVPEDSGHYGWPLKLMLAIAVAAYLLAGIAKVRYAGDTWATGEVLRNYIAVDALKKILLGSTHSPLAAILVESDWIFVLFAYFTLVVELGAPVALLSRRVAVAWSLAIMSFHWGVLAMMAIVFPYPMFGFAFLPAFRVERLAERLRARWLGRQGSADLRSPA